VTRRMLRKSSGQLWSRLRNRQLDGWKFKRQVPKGRYIVDFYCAEARLIVELDGGQHAHAAAVAHDARRTTYLQESGFRVARFWNNEVFENLDGVTQAIWHKLQEPPLPDSTAHSLQPSGRGFG